MLCFPGIVIAALALMLTLFLGFFLGKLWEKSERLLFYSENERNGRRQERVFERERGRHYDEEGRRARKLKFVEDGEDVNVFFTKTGTKVHLLKCAALKATDLEKTRKSQICKLCIKLMSERE